MTTSVHMMLRMTIRMLKMTITQGYQIKKITIMRNMIPYYKRTISRRHSSQRIRSITTIVTSIRMVMATNTIRINQLLKSV